MAGVADGGGNDGANDDNGNNMDDAHMNFDLIFRGLP
jgi:hypothetical protein